MAHSNTDTPAAPPGRILFRKNFARPSVFVVVHVRGPEHAVRNAAKAHEGGADGVFLIRHHGTHRQLLAEHDEVVRSYPDLWVGLNFLDLRGPEAFEQASRALPHGLWTDSLEMPGLAPDESRDLRAAYGGIHFGGAAFKYQRQVRPLEEEARFAAARCDVVTTSGDQTGSPPSLEKIVAMRGALGSDVPLAIASGISESNVDLYATLADAFLVATSVTDERDEVCGTRVRRLVDALRA